VFRPLVFVGFHLWELFQKRLIGVGKDKQFYACSYAKRELV
jgi:hypothetical protein